MDNWHFCQSSYQGLVIHGPITGGSAYHHRTDGRLLLFETDTLAFGKEVRYRAAVEVWSVYSKLQIAEE
jgi:hypothetical protein